MKINTIPPLMNQHNAGCTPALIRNGRNIFVDIYSKIVGIPNSIKDSHSGIGLRLLSIKGKVIK